MKHGSRCRQYRNTANDPLTPSLNTVDKAVSASSLGTSLLTFHIEQLSRNELLARKPAAAVSVLLCFKHEMLIQTQVLKAWSPLLTLSGEVWELQEKDLLEVRRLLRCGLRMMYHVPCLPPSWLSGCQVSSASLADPLHHHWLQSQAMEAAVGWAPKTRSPDKPFITLPCSQEGKADKHRKQAKEKQGVVTP